MSNLFRLHDFIVGVSSVVGGGSHPQVIGRAMNVRVSIELKGVVDRLFFQ